MFEKYNEKARRALFFARYEASKLGSRVIESEHILLGVLREGEEIIKEIFSRFNVKPEQIRREVEGDRLFVDRISSSAELPLSEESKKILAYAAHEAESMLHQYVGTEHLLIGILRVESSTAARIPTAVSAGPPAPAPPPPKHPACGGPGGGAFLNPQRARSRQAEERAAVPGR